MPDRNTLVQALLESTRQDALRQRRDPMEIVEEKLKSMGTGKVFLRDVLIGMGNGFAELSGMSAPRPNFQSTRQELFDQELLNRELEKQQQQQQLSSLTQSIQLEQQAKFGERKIAVDEGNLEARQEANRIAADRADTAAHIADTRRMLAEQNVTSAQLKDMGKAFEIEKSRLENKILEATSDVQIDILKKQSDKLDADIQLTKARAKAVNRGPTDKNSGVTPDSPRKIGETWDANGAMYRMTANGPTFLGTKLTAQEQNQLNKQAAQTDRIRQMRALTKSPEIRDDFFGMARQMEGLATALSVTAGENKFVDWMTKETGANGFRLNAAEQQLVRDIKQLTLIATNAFTGAQASEQEATRISEALPKAAFGREEFLDALAWTEAVNQASLLRQRYMSPGWKPTENGISRLKEALAVDPNLTEGQQLALLNDSFIYEEIVDTDGNVMSYRAKKEF